MKKMKKGLKYLMGIIAATLTIGSSTFAAEYSVAPVQATWYTNDQTIICEDADVNTVVVPACEKDVPVNIIGVTSNGFWQVQLDRVYYIPGEGLSQVKSANANVTQNAVTNTTTATTNVSTGSYVWKPKTDAWSIECINVWTHKDIDRTSDALYISIRNELEVQYQTGAKTLTCRRECVGETRSAIRSIMRQVMLDMTADHTDINHNYYDVNGFWYEIPQTIRTGQHSTRLQGGSGYQEIYLTRQ